MLKMRKISVSTFFPTLEEMSTRQLLLLQSGGKINQQNQMLSFVVLWHPSCVL